MLKYLKTAAILAIICAISAIVLAVMNNITLPKIIAYENQKTLDALNEVSSSMTIGNREDIDDPTIIYRYQLSKDSVPSGWILGLKAYGYGGEMNLVASFDNDGKIMASKLVSDSETPGVGKKAANAGYMDKFINKMPIPTSKAMLSEEEASTVSGASITFGGISKALSYGSMYVQSLK